MKFLTNECIENFVGSREDWRREAFKSFKKFPLPNFKEEDWRYTDLRNLDLSKLYFPEQDFKKIFSVKLTKDFSDGEIIFTDLLTAFREYPELAEKYFMKIIPPNRDKFNSLHYCLLNNGIFLFIPENVKIKFPLETVFSFSNSSFFLHNIIILGKGAELTLFERYHSNDSTQTIHTDMSEIYLDEDSKLDFFYLQKYSKNVFDFSIKKAVLKRNSSVKWFFGLTGGKLSRLKVETILDGEGAICENLGLFYGNEKQHIDISTLSHHKFPNTFNRISTKGVLNDFSTSVYRGLIRIEKNAQRSDSYLEDHTLLLNENALANSIPSLQIEANDVNCKHGASIGNIDEEQLFYLMSRGLEKLDAEILLVAGFFESLLKKIGNEKIKAEFSQTFMERLNGK